MRQARPKHEDDYVTQQIQPLLRAFKREPMLLIEFYQFAVQDGDADPALLPGRVAHVIRGTAPTAYVFALMMKFARLKKLIR